LLDAALCLLGATFGHQSNDWQVTVTPRNGNNFPKAGGEEK
jgi:hypothetical protein